MSVLVTAEVSNRAEDVDYERICQFIYLEARLQDTHQYDAWEALWTDDASYWVPVGGDHTDPDTQLSIIYDNRARIATRVRQLKSGARFAQAPRSNLARVVSNVEITGRTADAITAEAAFLLHEQRSGRSRLWSGRTRYVLRVDGGEVRMAAKKVLLTNSTDDIPTLAFLI